MQMNRLSMLENMMLKKIFLPKRAVTSGGKIVIIKGFTICPPLQIRQ
jgi:hypothetical protein